MPQNNFQLIATLASISAGVFCVWHGAEGGDVAPTSMEFSQQELAAFAKMTANEDGAEHPSESRELVAFGSSLFESRDISNNRVESCAGCHRPDCDWTDGRASPPGAPLERNTPSLWNVSGQRWLYWDGRSMDLAVQAVEALQAELDTGPVELLRAIRQAPDLARQYEVLAQDRSLPRPACLVGDKAETEACRGEQAFGLAALGLAAFERTINAEDSDFDRFVRTLKAQPHTAERPLDANALRGLQLFVGAAGCITCHNGPYLSDGEFHAIGIPPFETALHPDPGRRAGVETLKGVSTMDRWAWIVPAEKRASYEELRHYLSLADGLWGEFRTPSLRNVAYTAPYMHNGRLRTLEEVLDYYNSGGLNIGGSKWEPHRDDHNETIIRPLGLTDGERQDIIAFLRSLSSHPNPENRSSCVITR